MAEEVADKTAAINLGQVEEPSKNALKKAQKQKELAEKKANKSATDTTKEVARSEAKKAVSKAPKKKIEGAALIGIDIAKEDDFAGWYQQVLTKCNGFLGLPDTISSTKFSIVRPFHKWKVIDSRLIKGDFLDYYDVSGCYILKPPAWFIWEQIRDWFDLKIKKLGVRNCAFPLFVSEEVLSREKAHIEGFAAEVAWVTHAGTAKLDKKIAIRPTSETVMYPYYAKWIRSHRDLPLRLNQWNSVVRWEFKNPTPFLRTREFHWQEGHTAHLKQEDASEEVLQIMEFYAGVYEELLAIPVIRGRKTDKEKFAGGDYTTTVEGYIATTGRGIQGGTSHHLGQNFSKMFGITVEDPSAKEGEKKPPINVFQNSWGLSTRTIGVMVMTHGDNRGLVVPPRVSEVQVVIVPVGITAKSTEDEKISLHQQVNALVEVLRAEGIRAEADQREGPSPGWKFNDWEMKGVPLRLEFGPKDAAAHQVTTSRRDIEGNDGKGTIQITELAAGVKALLDSIQKDLYSRAEQVYREHTKTITSWDDFVPALNAKNVCLIPHCLTEKCEDEIKELSARTEKDEVVDERAPAMGAKSLCIPFEQPEGFVKGETRCTNPNCKNMAEKFCLFGRSY